MIAHAAAQAGLMEIASLQHGTHREGAASVALITPSYGPDLIGRLRTFSERIPYGIYVPEVPRFEDQDPAQPR